MRRARVITTSRLASAVAFVEQDGLSAAVLDRALGDGDSSYVCGRLQERGIPFVIYSGFSETGGVCLHAPHVSKPADPQVLVTTIVGLLHGQPGAN